MDRKDLRLPGGRAARACLPAWRARELTNQDVRRPSVRPSVRPSRQVFLLLILAKCASTYPYQAEARVDASAFVGWLRRHLLEGNHSEVGCEDEALFQAST